MALTPLGSELFNHFRWCRFAQPPANGFDPSRVRIVQPFLMALTLPWSKSFGGSSLIEHELLRVDDRPEDVLVGGFLAGGAAFGGHLFDVVEGGFLVLGGGLAGEGPEE